MPEPTDLRTIWSGFDIDDATLALNRGSYTNQKTASKPGRRPAEYSGYESWQ
jgi:hypothetical protein